MQSPSQLQLRKMPVNRWEVQEAHAPSSLKRLEFGTQAAGIRNDWGTSSSLPAASIVSLTVADSGRIRRELLRLIVVESFRGSPGKPVTLAKASLRSQWLHCAPQLDCCRSGAADLVPGTPSPGKLAHPDRKKLGTNTPLPSSPVARLSASCRRVGAE